jgi:hypothetical protein
MWVESDKPAGIDPHEFAPVLVHLCALTNIAVFALGMQVYLRLPAARPTATGTLRAEH